MNNRYIRASEYLSRFDIKVRYILGKDNIIPDALSRLLVEGDNILRIEEDILNVVKAYLVITIHLDKDFKTRL